VVEIRDSIESYCQGVQYAQFMNALVPAFLKILDGNPVFISTSPEQVSARRVIPWRRLANI
jgi:transformation/transcription domain-associated protein